MSKQKPWLTLSCATLLALTTGCKTMALNAVADAMSASGGGYGSDDDPELIAAAAPFGLKTMESLLEQLPEHRGLLLALSSGFVQFGVAFVDEKADAIEEDDYDGARKMRARAKRLYRRALGYGLRGLEVEYEDFETRLRADASQVLAEVETEDVAALYWTCAAWGLLISHSKSEPDAIADLPLVKALAQRALELDEGWNDGSLYELMISLETSLPQGSKARARLYFEKAIKASGGTRAGPYVTLAQSVSVKEQNAREFHQLLAKALAVNPDETPKNRLVNVIMQERARRLKSQSGDLFIEDIDQTQTSTTTGL